MKILAIIAGPVGKGNTYRTVQNVETHLKGLDESIEFESLVLKDIDLQTCLGCFQCLARGEHLCPLKDGREEVERKMAGCDGLIFASPVYVYNMSWLAKNFVDCFAYICHRPRFHGQRAMAVATTGGVGLGFTLFTLAFPLMTWGFDVVARLGVECPPGKVAPGKLAAIHRKNETATRRAAAGFYRSLTSNRKRRPRFIGIVGFMLQKAAFSQAPPDSADYRYWKNQGWLDKKTSYYYKTKISLWQRWLAGVIARVAPL